MKITKEQLKQIIKEEFETLKVEMVEVDIRQTKDSQIVCFHDPDIQGELIRDLDYSEIIEKDSQIPTLEQVLWSAKGKIGIEIELKESGYELEVVSIARDYFNYDNFYALKLYI